MLNWIIFFAAFDPLIWGADTLVNSASSIAKRLNIPTIVIGLTIVAFGTSAPELVVNVFASISKSSDITLGNIVGSNLFNVMVILGISAIIYPIAIQKSTTWIEIPLNFLAAGIILFLANDAFFDNRTFSEISFIDGIVLLSLFSIFIGYNITLAIKGDFSEDLEIKEYTLPKAILFFFIGLAGLVLGGKLIVDNAVAIAQSFGISERIIGLTIISIGTSLPELATSAVAAYRKNADIAIGNIVGSNIFNIFFVLGISALINPIPVQNASTIDMSLNIAGALLLFLFVFTGKNRQIDRIEGGIFVSIYIFYLIYILTL